MLAQLFWRFVVKVGQQFEFFKLTQVGYTVCKIMILLVFVF